jgi:molecular chaperone HtpG
VAREPGESFLLTALLGRLLPSGRSRRNLRQAPQPRRPALAPWRFQYGPLAAEGIAVARLFETVFDPVCAIPLQGQKSDSSGAGSDLAGLLWIQDRGSYASSDNRNGTVFVRGC